MSSDAKNENITLNDLRAYAWDYFKLHADQRMKLFHFFLVFATIISTGLASTFQPTIKTHFIGIVLGILLVVISFIFWKLDERNKYLTKHGETALKFIEQKFQNFSLEKDGCQVVQLFNSEECCTTDLKKYHKYLIHWERQFSHSKSLNCLFIIFGTIGVTGVIASFIMLAK